MRQRRERRSEREGRKNEEADKFAMDATIQIFVNADDSKTVSMEVSTRDKVHSVIEKVHNTASGRNQDANAGREGRMLSEGEELGNCRVRDGSTVQVVSSLRGGGKHKDKKVQIERKQAEGPKKQKFAEEVKSYRGPVIQECDKDAVIQMVEDIRARAKRK